LYEKAHSRAIKFQSTTLRENIERCNRHRSIIQLVARAFYNQWVVEKTGYVFAALEPLEYIGSGVEGGKSFDLALLNTDEKRLIFIEARTTASYEKGRQVLKDLREKIGFTEENFDTFLKDIDAKEAIDWKNVEFVVCIEKGRGSEGCSEALSNCVNRRKETNLPLPLDIAERTSVWQYLWAQKTRGIILDKSGKHKSKALVELLDRGIVQDDLPINVPIPFLLTDLPWVILFHTVSHLVNRNFLDTSISDNRMIRIDDMVEYAAQVACVRESPISQTMRKHASDVIRTVINHGIEYDMITREGEFIKVRGRSEKERSIITEFQEKYEGVDFERHAGTYAKKKADYEAKRYAVEEYARIYPSTLEPFL